ncbi:hypothetical protein FBY03_1241 [Pseudomonas sp. SJZ079]|uniref:hypothetical protein n=1 Tax=Pseudomonas sp. SJZ079 TaxID=2572887 RepID=UPI00119B73A3|nr:hypothetical protein [Pseudomonas sp. SJZ079]TWC30314.1 hypothetical protein FBY03_1241 [Pseudomonas sp. SJZ079]
MAWKLVLYGSEETSKVRIIMLNFVFVIAILGGYGYWVDFVPSSEWAGIGFNLAIAATILFVSTYYFALAIGRAKFQPKTSMPTKILAITLLPFLAFLLFFLAITHGSGDIATQVFGHDTKLTTELSKEQRHSKRGCEYHLKGYAIEKALPDHICVSKAEFDTLPKTGEYTLQVEQTPLGVHIKHIAPAINR